MAGLGGDNPSSPFSRAGTGRETSDKSVIGRSAVAGLALLVHHVTMNDDHIQITAVVRLAVDAEVQTLFGRADSSIGWST